MEDHGNRLLLSVAAYVPFQALQGVARTTALGPAQVWTLRERLVKIAIWVERSVRRIVLHLPQAFPWRDTWCVISRRRCPRPDPAIDDDGARPGPSHLCQVRATLPRSAAEPVARGMIPAMPPRALISARELSTWCSLEPSRRLVSAFTNSPG